MDRFDYAKRLKVIATNEWYTWIFISERIGISVATLKSFLKGKHVSQRTIGMIKEYVDHYENAKH